MGWFIVVIIDTVVVVVIIDWEMVGAEVNRRSRNRSGRNVVSADR